VAVASAGRLWVIPDAADVAAGQLHWPGPRGGQHEQERRDRADEFPAVGSRPAGEAVGVVHGFALRLGLHLALGEGS
jgi:hypothetical protein